MTLDSIVLIALSVFNSLILLLFIVKIFPRQQHNFAEQSNLIQERLQQIVTLHETIHLFIQRHEEQQNQQRQALSDYQINGLKLIQDSLTQGMQDSRQQISSSLRQHADLLSQRIDKIAELTQQRLSDISNKVDQQLNEGFAKTNATFVDVVSRLAKIDEAQKKISELSSNVIDLQKILADKRSRGAFGEVQLNALVRNVLPEQHFTIQARLNNNTRVDCLLLLPPPTGNLAIDAKFPLESYQRLNIINNQGAVESSLRSQFRQDVRKHIHDIANKYIIPGTTADGAMMFIPAEAIFADIHAYFPELIEEAHRLHVWIVSPTTLMAVLTTARAVLKDDATRQQVHIIQDHLVALSKDFARFQQRMNNLARHIEQANKDVEEVHKSSQKITNRFVKIEKVELQNTNEPVLLE